MEEVAGRRAVLVDPLDPDSIVAGIREASVAATSWRRLGPERAPSFLLGARAPKATAAVYRELA
jgi:hypothetical protein